MRAAGTPSELEIVTVLRSRARILCPAVCLVAVPNAAKRSMWAAQRAKREGMATGFPDLIALAPGRIAFLEMKTATGALSTAQREWLDRLRGMGFPCGVFRDPDAALAFLAEQGFPFIGRIAA